MESSEPPQAAMEEATAALFQLGFIEIRFLTAPLDDGQSADTLFPSSAPSRIPRPSQPDPAAFPSSAPSRIPVDRRMLPAGHPAWRCPPGNEERR